MNSTAKITSALILVLYTGTAWTQNKEPAPSRGQLLYENHCTSCHDSVVHVRANRRAKSSADVAYWVQRWSFDTGLGWKADEIDAVTQYLMRRYYKFEKPK